MKAATCAAAGCLVAIAAYALFRIGQATFGTEPDPALALASPVGLLWRTLMAVFAGGAAAFAFHLGTRDVARLGRVLARAVPWVAALIVVQALFWP